MPAQTTGTFPTTAMIDTYRASTAIKIQKIIGFGTADSNGVAADIESDAVGRKIRNIINGNDDLIEDLLPEEVTELENEFGVTHTWAVWEPGKNT